MVLRFHLAGINNQNFLMRDEQTGTYWQQITGRAISGPLAGRQLELVSADELSYSLWRKEQPAGTVLQDVHGFETDYAPRNWDEDMAKYPTVISFAQAGLKPRDLMIGVQTGGSSRAYPFARAVKEKLIQDNIAGQPILVWTGPDNVSVRVFSRRLPGGREAQFYQLPDSDLVIDSESGSRWDFKGCAVSGMLQGACLTKLECIKDYWFDWRNYNPATTIYGIKEAALN